jgi:hypothetical protein
MAGLVPAIHVFFLRCSSKTWMPGTSPGMTVFLLQAYACPVAVLPSAACAAASRAIGTR